MKRRARYQLHVGTASILLVFLTLCLSSFAILTLVGANADKRLSDKLSTRTKAYYGAVAEAERLIADVYENGMSQDGLTKDFLFDENQYLRVTIGQDGTGQPVITEYRVFTDETGMDFDENPFRVNP